jgi:hypothetical protein
VEQCLSGLQIIARVAEVVERQCRLRIAVVVEEAVVEVCLIRYGCRDTVYRGWCNEVAPVVVVVEAVLHISRWRVGVRFGQEERVGVGEEVGNRLALEVSQERVRCIV